MLDLALDGRGAFRRFKAVLSDYPVERERWFAFRQERLDQEIKEWLAENDIEPTTWLPTPLSCRARGSDSLQARMGERFEKTVGSARTTRNPAAEKK